MPTFDIETNIFGDEAKLRYFGDFAFRIEPRQTLFCRSRASRSIEGKTALIIAAFCGSIAAALLAAGPGAMLGIESPNIDLWGSGILGSVSLASGALSFRRLKLPPKVWRVTPGSLQVGRTKMGAAAGDRVTVQSTSGHEYGYDVIFRPRFGTSRFLLTTSTREDAEGAVLVISEALGLLA